MAKNKTQETVADVHDFLQAINDETKRNDCLKLIELFTEATALPPKLWGTSIVGFGSYHYKYASGQEDDSALVSFAPRASSIALYLYGQFENREALLAKFGKHKTEKGCINIKKLADIDSDVLKEMINNHIKFIKTTYPDQK